MSPEATGSLVAALHKPVMFPVGLLGQPAFSHSPELWLLMRSNPVELWAPLLPYLRQAASWQHIGHYVLFTKFFNHMDLLGLYFFLLNSEAEFEISHVSQLLFFLASTTHHLLSQLETQWLALYQIFHDYVVLLIWKTDHNFEIMVTAGV